MDCRRNGAGLLVVCAVFIIRDRATDPSGNDYKIVQESDVMVKFNQTTGLLLCMGRIYSEKKVSKTKKTEVLQLKRNRKYL